nr:sensor histidine kinase [Microbulbifer guangxiensis]
MSTITLVNFLAALHGYRESMAAAQQLLDRQLAATAALLEKLPLQQVQSELPADGEVALQLWGEDGQSLLKSANTPGRPMVPLEGGYRETNFGNYRWRVYTHFSPESGRWIQVAERADLRFQLAERVVLESILPTLLALPLAALLIWLVIGRGLSSLRELANALREKRAEDLEPLQVSEPPQELQPVIRSTNALLERLGASFERERRFSADAAHELRTPISAIQVHLHNLERELQDAGLADRSGSLGKLRLSVTRMVDLVEQMLTLFRTNPEHYPARLEPLDLQQLAREVIAERYELFSARQQSISLQGTAVGIRGDVFALTVMIGNLLSNAGKYTPERGEILVTTALSDSRGYIQVEDSGPGIPAQERSKIFERFYRVGGDCHASQAEGSGLGLSIVAHIARLHRAEIQLSDSRFDTGLCVRILFPASSGTVLPGEEHA